MRHFPLFLDLQGRDVAVVGGGEVECVPYFILLDNISYTALVSPF